MLLAGNEIKRRPVRPPGVPKSASRDRPVPFGSNSPAMKAA
jgi:hypothetical protein